MESVAPDAPDRHADPLLLRILGEFLEMPGLRLTPKQAQRLWQLDEQRCHAIVGELVRAGFLRRNADGSFARVT